jgi:cytochrome o ubiquinol oxidase subunit 3
MMSQEAVSAEKNASVWNQNDIHHDKIGARTFGFWLYMLSDAMVYATLFAAYVVLSHRIARALAPMGRTLAHPLTAFWETLLLLSSALSCGLAMGGLKRGQRGIVILGLLGMLVLGGAFSYLSLHGFLKLIQDGITPERSGFLSSFYALVVYHALHIVFGLIWVIVMMVQVAVFGFHPNVVYRLLNLKIFWFFQAVIWILVFSFSYLGASL